MILCSQINNSDRPSIAQTFLIDAEGQPVRSCSILTRPIDACEAARGEGHSGYKGPAAAAIAQAVLENCVVTHAGKLIHLFG